ncbi:TetR/AcrR family transcriptional regulator [Sorangium atrum]|uniref:TetR/AcrR family transcriptional regulator n=1 Tax=Sorangium atrum TaxID=2995308 RepID=A0ABT5CG21_9BACT|nr:TetR/AcrR family transcriptional regulator [Sorangium aterium]MDC0685355.1 TetR/AcrR family transcriptional regulator [Sorangium aterium]
MGVMNADEPVERVFTALCEGRLTRDDLTARKIAAFLGQTTMVLYHHFGSLDGFLIRVDGLGWRRLAERLDARARGGADARSLAVGYVEFALCHPDLYWLMAERRFDRARLREQGRLRLARPLWSSFVELLRHHGSRRPEEDTHVLFAGLHGIAMLALSGRSNLGEVSSKIPSSPGRAPPGGPGGTPFNPGEEPNLGEGTATGEEPNLGEGSTANPGEGLAADSEVAFAAARRLADLVLPVRPPEPTASQAGHDRGGPGRRA